MINLGYLDIIQYKCLFLSLVAWVKLTPKLLWSWIVDEVRNHFGFELKQLVTFDRYLTGIYEKFSSTLDYS